MPSPTTGSTNPVLSEEHGIRMRLTPEDLAGIDPAVFRDVPFSFARSNRVIPLRREGDRMYAAVSDIQGVLALRELCRSSSLVPCPVFTEAGVILEGLNKVYGQMGSAEEVMDNLAGEDLSLVATEFHKPKDILELTEEAPIIRLLNALFQQAVKDRASDIHIEPYERELDVRMRVDGILRQVLSPPKIIQDALISRVKIMAGLDIAEKRLPQDGRIRLIIGGRDVDIRVSIVPTTHGERAVLRLLDRSQGVIGLGDIGLGPDDVRNFSDYLSRTSGIILVTGPTGSGKTTTLYAVLNRVHTGDENIITVEDPVEYQLRGVGQIQVNPKIGLTFASGLRSILRQDPDIILVGEIRDTETAEIAVQASLTGHLVLSTLHTNDSASALTRLIDMGIEPFLIASSLLLVVAQRLVRTVCSACGEAREANDEERSLFEERMPERFGGPLFLRKGRGCALCRGSGYMGRTGIFEMLPIDDRIKQMIMKREDARSIRNYATGQGVTTLYRDGLGKVLDGITTLEELLRVTQSDYAPV